MSLTVGTNTYATLTEANEYIASNYLSTDELLIKWGKLSNSDKEVLLKKSCVNMESILYKGQKENITQKLAFPRVRGTYHRISNGYSNGGYMKSDDEKIKKAQIENALSLLDTQLQERVKLQDQNISSVKIGSLSENYKPNKKINRLLSPVANSFIREWIGNAFNIQ